jgi:TolB-like protein/tetratricopeptide (TPR) repeat protein
MKRCPECRRDYYDETLSFCLEDGVALVQGSVPITIGESDESATAIWHETTPISESPTRAQTQTTDNTAIMQSGGDIVAKARSFDKLLILAPIALAVVVLTGFFGYRYLSPAKQIESIAVMPFVNESGNADIEYLSDGMTETLITSLSRIPELSVSARGSVFRYKGKEIEPGVLGKELNVQAVLTGKVSHRGQELSLYVELVDVATEKIIWSETYDRQMASIVGLQKDIVRDVSQKLQTKLSSADEARLAKNHTANAEAYKLYLQGRYYWNKRTPLENEKALKYYEDAIALDPTYALAYAALADSYLLQLPAMHRAERFPKARAAAMKALEIDDTLGEAHAALAEVEVSEWNWPAAERGFKRALELNPNYPTAHHWYAEYLSRFGRHDEAVREIKRAQELDPLSIPISMIAGHVLMMARRYDEAIAQFKQTLEMDQNFHLARAFLAETYLNKGMYEEALNEAEKRVTRLQDAPEGQVASQLENFAQMRAAYRESGARGFHEKRLEKQGRGAERPFIMARLYAQLGDKDRAFEWLEKVVEKREGDGYLNVDPALDPVRGDPRFREMLKKAGFPY